MASRFSFGVHLKQKKKKKRIQESPCSSMGGRKITASFLKAVAKKPSLVAVFTTPTEPGSRVHEKPILPVTRPSDKPRNSSSTRHEARLFPKISASRNSSKDYSGQFDSSILYGKDLCSAACRAKTPLFHLDVVRRLDSSVNWTGPPKECRGVWSTRSSWSS
jgi:hypothetical protein